jgi:hypothetical protein
METSVSFDCPYCGSSNFSVIDAVEGVQEWVTDCATCCRPVTVKIRVRDGEISELELLTESD